MLWDMLTKGIERAIFEISTRENIRYLMEEADSLKDEDFDSAFECLNKATRLYHRVFGGYDKSIDVRFNEIFLSFMEKYPPRNFCKN